MAETQVHIYFGSQSGTAECFSEEFAAECGKEGIAAEVLDLDVFEPEVFKQHRIVVLFVSTYGDGEPTDNARKFHSWASDPKNHNGFLSGQRFAVMGLGDMNYAKFNNMGVMTDSNLERLGGTRLNGRGVGDDCQDIQSDFEKWMKGGIIGKLHEAIAAVMAEGGFAPRGADGAAMIAAPVKKAPVRQICVLIGKADNDSAAKGVGEALVEQLRSKGCEICGVLCLSDRKAVDAISKLPKKAIVVAIVEATLDGLCAAGKKIVRNMNIDIDANGMIDKDISYSTLIVTTSADGASAAANRDAICQKSETLTKAFERTGMKVVPAVPVYVDAGVEDVAPVVGTVCQELSSLAAPGPAADPLASLDGPAELAPSGEGWRRQRSPGPADMPRLVMAASAAELEMHASAPGGPADILAKMYFETERTQVMGVRELRAKPDSDGGFSTVELELKAVGALAEYQAGGTLSVVPETDPRDVEAILPLLGLVPADLDKFVAFAPAREGAAVSRPFPTPCTLREALSRYCDLARAPTKKMISGLQASISDEAARERLAQLAADSDAMKLLQSAELCCNMREFWAAAGVTRLDPGLFLLYCPRQKAREFTIASSPKASPDRIVLCVSLTSKPLPPLEPTFEELRSRGLLPPGPAAAERSRFFGLCSRWFCTGLKKGDVLLAKQRPSPLKLPEADVPVVMVGAGAGVAPFMGFLQEMKRGPKTAPAALFFGCRKSDEDWIYREEMSSSVKLQASACAALARMQVGPKRPLVMLQTAFSREAEGKYVQDQIRASAPSVRHWVDVMNGCVFICGSSAMGNGVLDALAEVLEGGRERVDALRKEGRLVAEMWG